MYCYEALSTLWSLSNYYTSYSYSYCMALTWMCMQLWWLMHLSHLHCIYVQVHSEYSLDWEESRQKILTSLENVLLLSSCMWRRSLALHIKILMLQWLEVQVWFHHLLEEITKKWWQKFPAMPTKQCASSVTSTESVVEGIAENGWQYLSSTLSTLYPPSPAHSAYPPPCLLYSLQRWRVPDVRSHASIL